MSIADQSRCPRRDRLSGVVVVHTTEAALDAIAPDTGAENVAAFIARRPDPGSYHVLVDTDSVVDLIVDGCEAFGTNSGDNRHAWHIAMACRTTDLDPDAWHTHVLLRAVAAEAVEFWRRNGFDPAAARWLTRSEAQAKQGPGYVNHGTLQPQDRTDAFAAHPDRVDLELLLARFTREAAGTTTPQPLPEDDVTPDDIENIAKRVTAYLASPNENPGTVVDPYLRDAVARNEARLVTLLGRDPTVSVDLDPEDIAAAVAGLPEQTARRTLELLGEKLG